MSVAKVIELISPVDGIIRGRCSLGREQGRRVRSRNTRGLDTGPEGPNRDGRIAEFHVDVKITFVVD